MNGIKSVIFDLGGVLYTLDLEVMWSGFHEKCGKDIVHIQNAIHEAGLYSYECGKLSSEQYFMNLTGRLECTMSFPEFRHLWNSPLIKREDMFSFAASLKQYAEVFILSNTNEINAEVLDADLRSLTPNVLYSFQVGCMKPEPRIYTKALKRWDIRPEESIFIDDVWQNCQGARQAGIAVHHFSDFSTLISELHGIGVIPGVSY